MLARCHNPSNKAYRYYGERGVTVCKRWHSYAAFIADIGPRPSPQHSLERRNNNKGYSPGNCCWSTRSEQQKNKSTTRFYTDGTFTGTLVECAQYVGISKELAHWRWKHHNTFNKEQVWQELQKRP